MALFNRSRQCYSKNRQVCKVLCTDTSVHKKQTVPLVCIGGVTEWGRLLRQPQKTRKYQPRSDLRPQGMICTSAQALRWFMAWAIVNACPPVTYSSSLKRIVALVISGTASCSCVPVPSLNRSRGCRSASLHGLSLRFIAHTCPRFMRQSMANCAVCRSDFKRRMICPERSCEGRPGDQNS